MAEVAITEELRDFIIRYIDTIAQLEALLLLRGNPDMDWDASDIAARIYASVGQVQDALTRLVGDGLLTSTGVSFKYGCRTAELARMVDQLAEAYGRHLIAITNIIHDKPPRIHQFADAFNLRKDK